MSSNTTNDATTNTPGVTIGTPSGAGGGGNPFNWGRLSPQSSPPTIQLVTTNPAKILKEKFTHDEIVEVYESFKAMRYSDATVDFIKFVDAEFHDLLKMDFDQQDWKVFDADDFFKHLLGEYPSKKNSAKASFEERFHSLESSLFKWDIENPKCYNALFQAVKKIFTVPDSLPMDQQRIQNLCSILTEKIGKTPMANKKLWQEMKQEGFKPRGVDDWFVKVRQHQNILHSALIYFRDTWFYCEFQRKQTK